MPRKEHTQTATVSRKGWWKRTANRTKNVKGWGLLMWDWHILSAAGAMSSYDPSCSAILCQFVAGLVISLCPQGISRPWKPTQGNLMIREGRTVMCASFVESFSGPKVTLWEPHWDNMISKTDPVTYGWIYLLKKLKAPCKGHELKGILRSHPHWKSVRTPKCGKSWWTLQQGCPCGCETHG